MDNFDFTLTGDIPPELRPGAKPAFPGADAPPVSAMMTKVNPDTEKERFTVLWNAVNGKCTKWHDSIKSTRRDFRIENTGDDNPDIDDDKRVKLTVLADIARMGAAVLSEAGYQLKCVRLGEDDYDKQISGMVEKYLRATVQHIEQRRNFSLRMDMALGVLKDGASVLHWWFDDKLPGMKAVKTESELDSAPLNVPPVDATTVDPLEFYPMVGEQFPFRYIIHKTQRTVQDVYDEWAGDEWAYSQLRKCFGTLTPQEQLTQTHDFMDYWGWAFDGEGWYIENAILYKRECVIRPFVRMDGYTVLPWVMATAIEDRSEKEYHNRWLPFTYWAKFHVRRRERLLGRLDAILDDIANTSPKHILPAAGEAAHIEQGMKTPIMLNGSEGEDYISASQQYGTAPMDFRYLISDTEVQTQRSGLPDAMFGMGSGGSGYAFDQAQEGGRMTLVFPRQGLANAYRQFFEGVSSLVAEHVPMNPIYAVYREEMAKNWKAERVYLHGWDMDDWIILVQWSATLPDDAMRNTARATQLAGLLSQETIIGDVLGYEDPMTELDRRLKEKVKFEDPRMMEMVAWDAYRRQGGRPTLSQAETLKISLMLEQEAGKMEAAGMPPEFIQQHIESLLQGIRMAAMGQVPTDQLLGGPPPQAMGGNNLQRQPSDPQRDSSTGLPRQMQTGAPPNGPTGPGAVYRQMGNQMDRNV